MASHGFFESIARDLSGPGMFGGKVQLRLFIQPLIAILLGVRFGMRDAKAQKPPFIASIARAEAKGERGKIFRRSLRDVVIPLCVALVIDSILQYLINHRVRPVAALIVGALLVYLPFAIVRALTNRVWTHGHRGQQPTHAS